MSDISTIVCHNRAGEEKKFCLRQCLTDDLAQILALQKKVTEALPDRNLFAWTTEEEIAESLALDYCLGVFDPAASDRNTGCENPSGSEAAQPCEGLSNRLVMFSLMITGRITPRNLGSYLDYTEEKLLTTVTYDSTFVDPDYRGYGLQNLAISQQEEQALSLGAAEALATVSPKNEHSLRNLRINGFEEAGRRRMYGGVLRLIMRKRL